MPEWKYKARALHQQCANFHHNPTCGSLISNRLCSIGDWLPGDYTLHENCWVEFQTRSLSSWWRIFRLDWYCAHQNGTEPQTQENLWRFKLSTQNCRSWRFSLLDCRGIEAFKRDGFRQAEQTNFQQASHHRSRNKTIRWKSLIPHHFPQRGEGLMRERFLEITKKRNSAAQAELAASCSLQPL